MAKSSLQRAAAIDEYAGGVRAVIAEVQGGGATVTAAHESDSLQACVDWLHSKGIARVVRVLPAGATVCRLVEAPEASAGEIASAASLLAEAQLPASVPAHRRTGGAAGLASSPGQVPVLLEAWPETTPAPPDLPGGELVERFAGRVAALSGTLGQGPGVVAWSDRGAGSVSILASDGSRSIARTLRLPAADEHRWIAGIDQSIRETVGRLPGGQQLSIARIAAQGWSADEQTETRLGSLVSGAGGVSSDQLAAWAAAAGAALAVASGDAARRPLFEMRASAELRAEHPVERFGAWLGRPIHWGAAIAASAALILLLPVAGAFAERELLQSRVETAEQAVGLDPESRAQTDRQQALFSELDKARWPMTKILADLTGAAPIGVDFDRIDLRAGERITVSGSADAFAKLTEMQSSLESSGVFERVQLVRTQDTEGGAVDFEMSAEVVARRAFSRAREIEDFGEQTLAQRLYGDRADAAGPGPAGANAAAAARPERQASNNRRRQRDDDSGDGNVFDEREEVAPQGPVPAALSEDDIGAMDREAVLREFPARRRAAARTDIDGATRDRLNKEVDQLRDRLKELRGG